MFYHIKNEIKQGVSLWMEGIDENIEKQLDYFVKNELAGEITLPSGDVVKTTNITLYGEIDLHNDKDKNYIKNTKLIVDIYGFKMYSNLNYDEGIVYPVENEIRWYDSLDNLKCFMLHHCYIGKPSRVIIYKKITKHGANKRNK